jgi:hypothetical protein
MDMAYSKEHIDTFVVISGDSDFSPLVSKLKELGKHVIGLGMQESTSDLLRDICDEFIYYEDLEQKHGVLPDFDSSVPDSKKKAFKLLLDSLLAVRRENKEIIWSSMVKDTMKRKKPSFNETYHGYRTFSELLEDAAKNGLLELEMDSRGRSYIVTRFGAEMKTRKPFPGRKPAPVKVRPPQTPPISLKPTVTEEATNIIKSEIDAAILPPTEEICDTSTEPLEESIIPEVLKTEEDDIIFSRR